MSDLERPDPLTALFAGQMFFFAGKFETKAKLQSRDYLEQLIVREGGGLADKLSAAVDCVVLKSPTSTSATEKKVAALNSKGANIEILSPVAVYQRIAPTQVEVNALIRAGDAGHRRFVERLEMAEIAPDISAHLALPRYRIEGWDARSNDLTCTPLWCLSLDACDFRDSKINKNLHSLQRIGPLNGCRFDNAHWCCRFSGATGCEFSRANLSGSVFQENARFEATFKFAKLLECDFSRADLSDSDFSGAVLREANFENALVQTAKFDGAKLQAINARDADFTNSSFVNANLQGANLTGAVLIDCDFSGANLRGAILFGATLTGAQLHGADVTDTDMALAKMEGVDFSQAIGVDSLGRSERSIIPRLQEFESMAKRTERCLTSIAGCYRGQSIQLRLQYEEFGRYPQQYCVSWITGEAGSGFPSWEETSANCAEAIDLLVNALPGANVHPHTVEVNVTPADEEFAPQHVAIATAVWCSAFGTEIPDQQSMEAQRRADSVRVMKSYQAVCKLLHQGDVAAWNAFDRSRVESIPAFHQADFRGLSLDHVNLCGLSFVKSQFEKASLKQSELSGTVFDHCCFDEAELEYANLSNTNLRTASFIGANLCGARLGNATMPVAPEAAFQNAAFNSSTSFPRGFAIPASMDWHGWGADPRTTVVLTNLKPVVQVLIHLRRLVDNNRIDKALAMLQSEKFALYCDANDSCVTGIVKSQSIASLVYSCRLTSGGDFACCTQNLNACGGLRGSLCKHLLVLLIGLTQLGRIDPVALGQWLAASRDKKPKLNKDAMSEIFLRYKGAESGELDWRPMETIPEDFYAL